MSLLNKILKRESEKKSQPKILVCDPSPVSEILHSEILAEIFDGLENPKNPDLEVLPVENSATKFLPAEISTPKISPAKNFSSVPTSPCPACHFPVFWLSVYARPDTATLADFRCLECEPPPAASLVGKRAMLVVDAGNSVSGSGSHRLVEIDSKYKIIGEWPAVGSSNASAGQSNNQPTTLADNSEKRLAGYVGVECGTKNFPLTIWTRNPQKYQPGKFGKIDDRDLAAIVGLLPKPEIGQAREILVWN